jgi:hypothetical protein
VDASGLEGQPLNAIQWDSLVNNYRTDGRIRMKLRLEPDQKCFNKDFFSMTDVEMGFLRNPKNQEESIKEFNYHLGQKLSLKIGTDNIPPLFYHMEKNFGIDNGRDFWIEFQLTDSQKNQLFKEKKFSLLFEVPIRGTGLAVLQWQAKLLKGIV